MIPDAGAVLNVVLGEWADSQPVPLALPNVPFTPPAGPYLAAHDLPARPVAIDLAQQCKVYSGIYQVNVSVPKGTGATTAKQLAALVAGLFPSGAGFPGDGVTVWVNNEPAISPGLIAGAAYTIPISFRYRVDVSPPSYPAD